MTKGNSDRALKPITDLGLRKKISRSLDAVDGKIVVLDRLFSKGTIDRIYHVILRAQYFFAMGAEIKQTFWSRYKPVWRVDLDRDLWGDELIATISQISDHLFPEKKLKLVSVYALNTTYGDQHNEHKDGDNGVTAVYYVNRKWNIDWHGETIFYSPDGDPLYAVGPKPGRLVVFSGRIRHRSAAPSRICFAPRMIIALKFRARSKASIRARRASSSIAT